MATVLSGAPARIPEIVVTKDPASDDGQQENLYTSRDIDEELDDILDEIENSTRPVEPVVKEAVQEFADAQRRKKYLFDGENLIRIVPKRSEKMKALFGKAYVLHKKIRDSMLTIKSAVVEKAIGTYSGYLSDYVAQTGPQIPPLIYYSVKDIEKREPVTRAWIYQTPASNRHINKVKRRFMRGKIPKVRN